MTITQIIDYWLPYTTEDKQCGMRKAKKARQRAEMAVLIMDYKQGKAVALPEEVLKLIYE